MILTIYENYLNYILKNIHKTTENHSESYVFTFV